MAALAYSSLAYGNQALHELIKRKSKNKNWAGKNPGIILVFCIVATVVLLLIVLTTMKKLAARKAARPAHV
jgi:hypothetical protein